jgi:hypothetical protein
MATDKPRIPKPAANEPGAFGQQIRLAFLAVYLANKRRQTVKHVWSDARALILPHAKGDGQ